MRQKIVDDMVLMEPEYVPLSEKQLTAVAYDVREDTIFGSWLVRERDKDLLHNVFAILDYLHDIDLKRMARDEIVHFYEYKHNKMDRTIEGYPCFMSCQMLNKQDWHRLQRKLREIEEKDRHEEHAL